MLDNDPMRVSAKADYAIRAAAELAAADAAVPLKAERIADSQGIPIKFLETILLELKHAGIVRSQRGPDGGYALAQPAAQINLADIIRAVDGPLANVRGDRPENISYRGAAARRRPSRSLEASQPAQKSSTSAPIGHDPRRPCPIPAASSAAR